MPFSICLRLLYGMALTKVDFIEINADKHNRITPIINRILLLILFGILSLLHVKF